MRARPQSRLIFVDAPVASMKTRCFGSNRCCPLRHAIRASATSGLSCSAACAVFLPLIPWRSKNRQTVPTPTRRPRSPRAERSSSSDVSGASDRRAKSQSAGASMTAERRSPPTPWGETVPLFRQRLTQETTVLGLTPKTPAAEQRDRPPSTDKTTRSRKSIEYICSSQDHQRKSIIKSVLMICFDPKMLYPRQPRRLAYIARRDGGAK